MNNDLALIEPRRRGHVVAQDEYLKRQRKRNEAQVDLIAKRFIVFLDGELSGVKVKAQRHRIVSEIVKRLAQVK